jgi:hypothetical protein
MSGVSYIVYSVVTQLSYWHWSILATWQQGPDQCCELSWIAPMYFIMCDVEKCLGDA